MQAGTPIRAPLETGAETLQGRKTRPSGLHASTSSAMAPVLQAMQLVSDELEQAEIELHQQLNSPVEMVSEINHYLASAGGKRLRPLITALGARAVGFEGPLARMMCVGELLHLGSLLHDDVVDEGIERRGQPAAQRVFGNPAAVLCGDVCLARSISLAAEEVGLKAVQELSLAVVGMAEGEILQLKHIGNLELGLDTYMDIIRRKSARLIAWCAAAGAWSCGADQEAEALSRYGTEVGIAFQITDDVLDYVGDKRLTGKRRGQDLSEGKLTLPLVLALESRPDLGARLARGVPSPERIPALIDEVCTCGAPERALDMARDHIDRGIEALQTLPDSPWRQALIDLAYALIRRVS